MAVRIRLRRTGTHKKPSYRVVVADQRAPRDGAFIEILGFYNPLTDPATVRVNPDRARYWLGVGAQPSETVRSILRREGLIDKDGKATAATESDTEAAATATTDASASA